MLKNYPKEVILKDGTGITLRPLQEGDEELLFKMFKQFSEDDRWFLDDDVENLQLIQNWVRNMDQNKVISIVAVLEGQIVGHANLNREGHGAERHIGKIRISIDPSFRERRLGTWMLLDLVNLGMAMGLELLVMQLVEDRDSSVIRGVRKLDFFETAVLEDYVKDREGNPHNLVIMVKHLHRWWDGMEESTP